jgi:hypothetical protein
VTFSEWLDTKAQASRLDACELFLARFRSAADFDPEFAAATGTALWALLSTRPGCDAANLLADMRSRAAALGGERLDNLSLRLLNAASDDIDREAGRLVSFWFRAIGLCAGTRPTASRAIHIARSYEKTFSALSRLMNAASEPNAVNDMQAAA